MAFVQAFFTALPVMNVWRDADVAPPSGAIMVSAQVTWMFSNSRPSVSAAIAAATLATPWPMSAAPMVTLTLVSGRTSQNAAAGFGRPVLPMP